MSTASGKLRIAIDAMGGDFAPINEVLGAIEAVQQTNGRFDVVLVGREDALKAELVKAGYAGSSIIIQHASEIVEMHDSPVVALKQKQDSSLVVGMHLHKMGDVDAFVSAGNTGAMTAAATLILGRVPGVSRPTIGAIFPSAGGSTFILDVGAVTDSKPHFLYEFGVMGHIFVEYIMGKEKPRVALLNLGEESSKGDELVKEAYKFFEKAKEKLNFIGNIEGKDILKGKADVIVCDGFVGNIVLKFGESVPSFLKSKFVSYAERGLLPKILMGILRKPLRTIFKDFDYQEFGGVPLLGVNGVAIIGHGRSTPKAIRNMLIRAEEMVIKRINTHIEQELAEKKG